MLTATVGDGVLGMLVAELAMPCNPQTRASPATTVTR